MATVGSPLLPGRPSSSSSCNCKSLSCSQSVSKSMSLRFKDHRKSLLRAAAISRHSGNRRNSNPSIIMIALPKAAVIHSSLFHMAASAIFFVCFGARACVCGPEIQFRSVQVVASQSESEIAQEREDALNSKEMSNDIQSSEGMELRAEFEKWKSKSYALTVPLRIVSLRGSVPPSWFKDFIQVQGRRLKLLSEFRGRLDEIFSELSLASSSGSIEAKSAMAADLVTVGDSWLHMAISGGMIEPMGEVEDQDWFKALSDRWKVYLRRGPNGDLDSNGMIWAAPYRWGSMVIAYKKSKFKKLNLAPIEDWGDLWRPELAGKISMVDSPREVVGAVLKFMGASYNTKNMEFEICGGRSSVMQNLMRLQRQVRLFDSLHYLKAFAAGDVWIAVGWSSDVLPAAKRMSDVAVVAPKSGSSLWADLWVIPAAARFNSNRIGGRVRSPSPLIHQWIEFCLQAARALPFLQEVIPGASPSALEGFTLEQGSKDLGKGKPKLDTNIIAGVPPPEILVKCEFLEPLSEQAVMDYQWLIAGMQRKNSEWCQKGVDWISSLAQSVGLKPRGS